mgnify:CR=1 FL=1
MKMNKIDKETILCQIFNFLVILILTIATSIIIYLLLADIGMVIFLSFIFLFIYGFLEEKFISINLNKRSFL